MYCPIEITKSLKLLEKWEEENINKILEEDCLEYVGTTYWKLEQYSVILVKRDKDWFKMAKKQFNYFNNTIGFSKFLKEFIIIFK